MVWRIRWTMYRDSFGSWEHGTRSLWYPIRFWGIRNSTRGCSCWIGGILVWFQWMAFWFWIHWFWFQLLPEWDLVDVDPEWLDCDSTSIREWLWLFRFWSFQLDSSLVRNWLRGFWIGFWLNWFEWIYILIVMILNLLQHDNEGGEMNLRLSQSMPGTHTLSRNRFYLDSDIWILIPNKFILIPRNWSWHGLCGELLLPRGSYSFLPPSWALGESSWALLWKCLGTYSPGDEQPIPSYLLPGNFKYRAVGDPIFFCAPGDLTKYLETRILFDGTSSNEWFTPLPIWKQ